MTILSCQSDPIGTGENKARSGNKQNKRSRFLGQRRGQHYGGMWSKKKSWEGPDSFAMASTPYVNPLGDRRFQIGNALVEQGAQPQADGAQSVQSYPSYRFYCRLHHGCCEEGRNYYFNCSQLGHMQREYPIIIVS